MLRLIAHLIPVCRAVSGVRAESRSAFVEYLYVYVGNCSKNQYIPRAAFCQPQDRHLLNQHSLFR